MKKILVWALPFLMGSVCQAEDITIRYNGSTAKVDQKAKDSVTVTVNGANVNIDSKMYLFSMQTFFNIFLKLLPVIS